MYKMHITPIKLQIRQQELNAPKNAQTQCIMHINQVQSILKLHQTQTDGAMSLSIYLYPILL